MGWIEKGWYSNSKRTLILLPLTLVFYVLYKLRLGLFYIGLKKQIPSPVPVIVVGNLSVGGTGKTPFVIYLAQLLQSMGYTPGIVSRGYGAAHNSESSFPRIVAVDSTPEHSGDEPLLIARKTQCPVVISPNRPAGVALLANHYKCDIVISDDGLQHYQMGRTIELVIYDSNRQFGNGWMLPVGPLREPISRLETVDLVIENVGFKSQGDYIQQSAPIESLLTGQPMPENLLSLSGPQGDVEFNSAAPKSNENTKRIKGVHLVSGIGHPERFEKTIENLGITVLSTTWFADHHPFSEQDFSQFSEQDVIVMTEKDAIKCRRFAKQHWYTLPIEAKISKQLEQDLKDLIVAKCS